MLKIAVATSDGTSIDEHFGQAREFRIFEVDDSGGFQLVGVREIRPHCPGDPAVAHSADATVEQLGGVDAVFVNRIGPGAARNLEEKGIKAFALSGPIDRALAAYGKRHSLIDAKIPGVSQGFTPAGGEPCGCSGRCR
ncbi:MAG: dinitrogenase iron-molybdenum cofactor biosynthesis protein [Geobacter sp.]|nr:dinitrogenase iron-molybdenum cofactor biosynthesis protein [Geobacter sp.]